MNNFHEVKLLTFEGKVYFCYYGTIFEPGI